MKAVSLLAAVALSLAAPAFAADSAKANAGHTAMKKKLAQCKASAAAQTPALNKEDTKKFVEACVAKQA